MSKGATADWYAATVQDISLRGVGLVAEVAFAPGSLLKVQFRRPGSRVLCATDAQVVYAHLHPRGWVHGCQFVHAFGEEDFAELVRKPVWP